MVHGPLAMTRVVVGFALDEQVYFLLGDVRHNTPLGAAFWQVGIAVEHLLVAADHPTLEELCPLITDLAAQEAEAVAS